MAADIQTKPTAASVDDFIAGIDNPRRREDARAMCDIMASVTGLPAVMWGPAIVGFGKRRYFYADGRAGTMLGIGFSPRKADLTLYMRHVFEDGTEQLEAMPEITKKGGCLHVKNLTRVDPAAFEAFTRRSWDAVLKETQE